MKHSVTKKNVLYAYPNVGTFGLGHSLLAWARCLVWCKQNNVPMLAPSWLRLRGHIGPLIRRERDLRLYQRLFQFSDYVCGVKRLFILATMKSVSAEKCNLSKLLLSGDSRLVIFSNLVRLNEETYFEDIIGHSSMILDALTKMTKSVYRPSAALTPHIAMHIRMGDFRKLSKIEEIKLGAKNCQIPIDWYVYISKLFSNQIGNTKVIVYSDGTDEELLQLLKIPGVIRAPRQQSITDLLSISQAALLVSSGSGFSTWGAFLGQVPRICFPGQRFVRVLETQNDIDLEPECDYGEKFAPDFISYIHTRIKS